MLIYSTRIRINYQNKRRRLIPTEQKIKILKSLLYTNKSDYKWQSICNDVKTLRV